MIYASILVNETNCSFCSDEMKKMKRELQWRIYGQGFAQCFLFMDYSHYLVFGKFDQGLDLLIACSTVGIFILVMMQMQIGFDANEQITSSQDVHY